MKPDKTAGLGRVFGLVAVLTVLSKFAGLARDIIVLQAFGTSTVADAYNYAYLLTGNILVLFGGLGGPFHSATVAILTPKKDDSSIGRLAGQLVLYTVLVLTIISVAAYFVAPNLVSVIAPATGHGAAYQHELWTQTTMQLRIMLPLVVIAGVVGISYGVLNVYGKFFWPSLSPAIASISIIVAVVGFADTSGGLALAWGTSIGAVGQMLAQIPGMSRCGLKWGFPLAPQPGLRAYFAMLWPAAVSTSIGQLTIYVDSFFTSQLQEGAWTAIVNANRLVQLPLGVLLTAMLVPILPRFTEQVAHKKTDELKVEFRRALRFLWFLALPMAALLLALPGPIIQVLFERGNFNSDSRVLVTTALVYLVPSIFFYVGRDLITRVFYAHHDSTTPYYVAVFAIIAKAIFDYWLVQWLGVGGISLATTLVTVSNLLLLTFFLRRKIGNLGLVSLVTPATIMLSASAACGLTSWFLYNQFYSLMPIDEFWRVFVSVSTASVLGLLIYWTICVLCKLDEPNMLLGRLKLKVAGSSERES